jgi:transcriptional regulator GlxA family with amidase domain
MPWQQLQGAIRQGELPFRQGEHAVRLLSGRFAFDRGVIAYLTSWRMQQAPDLLIATDRALIDIAGLAGYGSESAFSRALRREFAHSPGRLRRCDLAPAPD